MGFERKWEISPWDGSKEYPQASFWRYRRKMCTLGIPIFPICGCLLHGFVNMMCPVCAALNSILPKCKLYSLQCPKLVQTNDNRIDTILSTRLQQLNLKTLQTKKNLSFGLFGKSLLLLLLFYPNITISTFVFDHETFQWIINVETLIYDHQELKEDFKIVLPSNRIMLVWGKEFLCDKTNILPLRIWSPLGSHVRRAKILGLRYIRLFTRVHRLTVLPDWLI